MVAYAEKLFVLDETDLYKILGIEESTDINEINKIYRAIAKKYHPDKLGLSDPKEVEKAHQIFSKITSAYNTLKDPAKRSDYNYERRLRIEYEKTQQMAHSFSFSAPNVVKKKENTGININVNVNTDSKSEASKKEAAEEAKSAQAESLYNAALQKYKDKNIDAAILDLQTAIVIRGKIAKYHSTLGMLMKEKGWSGYAQSEFKQALNIDPTDKLALKYYEAKETVKQDKTKQSNKGKSGIMFRLKDFFAKIFKK